MTPATTPHVQVDGHGGPVPSLARDEWVRPEDRVAILAHDHWGVFSAKTGVSVYRYAPCHVATVLDRSRAGEDAGATIGVEARGKVPVHADLATALERLDQPPTRLVIGVAEPGGHIPPTWRADIATALEAGIPVLSGQHDFLADDPETAAAARRTGTPVVDLRRTPSDVDVVTGARRQVKVPVVLTLGTDCRSGKMTATVELHRAARRLGLKSVWVATGQTGLLLGPEAGTPVDRMIIDFAAGEVERQVLAACHRRRDGTPLVGNEADHTDPDIVWVEGQGALSHPAYSGVTAALLHGTFADAFVCTHVVGRKEKAYDPIGGPFPVLDLPTELGLAHTLAGPVTGATTAALFLATPHLDEAEARKALDDAATATGLPAFDPVRDGHEAAERMVEAVVEHLRRTRPDVAPTLPGAHVERA